MKLASFLLGFFMALPAQAQVYETIQSLYKKNASHVEKFYRDLHQNPELSFKEFKTAKKMTDELRRLGYTVTEKMGRTGFVAVLKNGKGPTFWLRADLDALPVEEKTNKSYTSQTKGVMHACGHDAHMATMIAYANILQKNKKDWRGTLVLVGQPAEEIGSGAVAMIKDGLYKKFPKPDYIFSYHVLGKFDAGTIHYTEGYIMAAVDSIDVVVKGVGGHGSTPHVTIDPVVLASKIVVGAQTLVSRNIDPLEPVVLSFGAINGGTKHNIIPDSVHLQATLRTYDPAVRKKMKSRLVEMVKNLAKAEGAPAPEVRFSESVPPVYNNLKLTEKMIPVFQKVAGKDKVKKTKRIMGAEDFAYYRQEGKYPSIMFFIGGAPRNKKNFGLNHNARFAPEYKSVIRLGAESIALAISELSQDSKN